MQHALSENLGSMEDEILTKMLEWAPVEQRLRGLPAGRAAAGCLRKSGSAGCRRKSLRPRWANKMRRGFANYSNGNKAVSATASR